MKWVWLLAAMADVDNIPGGIVPARLKLVKECQLPQGGAGALSGDGRFFAARAAAVIVYSTLTGQKTGEIDVGGPIHDTAFSYDGKLYGVAYNDGTVKLFTAADGKEHSSFHTGSGYSCSIAFARDGRTLVADDGQRTGLILYGIAEKKELKRVMGSGTSYTFISPNGRYVMASARALRIIDLQTEKMVKELLSHSVVKVAMSPDSRFCVAPDGTGRLVKWELATGDEVASSKLDGSQPQWPEYSPDGRWVAVTDMTGSIFVLDARTFAVVKKISVDENAPDGGSRCVGFTRDGLYLLGTLGGRVRLYSSR